MTDATQNGETQARPARRGGGLWLGFGLALGLGAAAGGYAAVSSGLLPAPSVLLGASAAASEPAPWADWQTPRFVTLEPMVVSLGAEAAARHLSVAVVLEVEPGAETAVEAARPQLRAALARFLRAVDERDFETPGLMLRLQAQMARRARLAAPPGTVRALLIQDFVLG